ncbi:MAG: 6,7-dimethyl-8-ribityllumazine synthase [Proteobacteria bacterium]|nr:6,7-dimethyl-8-ribityllumazine synthase [Pseudomonadota bacterium]
MSAPRIAVVAARFNENVTSRLLESCLEAIKEGAPKSKPVVVRVPGSYDIPWAAQELALTKRYDAVVTLGAIIKGETAHNDHIATALFKSLHEISLSTRVPVVMGVITPNDEAQAVARTRGHLNRGREAGEAAVALANLKKEKPWR